MFLFNQPVTALSHLLLLIFHLKLSLNRLFFSTKRLANAKNLPKLATYLLAKSLSYDHLSA